MEISVMLLVGSDWPEDATWVAGRRDSGGFLRVTFKVNVKIKTIWTNVPGWKLIIIACSFVVVKFVAAWKFRLAQLFCPLCLSHTKNGSRRPINNTKVNKKESRRKNRASRSPNNLLSEQKRSTRATGGNLDVSLWATSANKKKSGHRVPTTSLQSSE